MGAPTTPVSVGVRSAVGLQARQHSCWGDSVGRMRLAWGEIGRHEEDDVGVGRPNSVQASVGSLRQCVEKGGRSAT